MFYFGLALFCTAIFLVQFIGSVILGNLDLDFDVDGDGNVDFSAGDLLSFKGLLHFFIGFSWTMWFMKDQITILPALVMALVVGIIFMIVLYGAYILTWKLKNEIKREEGEELIGRVVEIYLPLGDKKYSSYTKINGSRQQITVESRSSEKYKTGDTFEIKEYENGIYYIL